MIEIVAAAHRTFLVTSLSSLSHAESGAGIKIDNFYHICSALKGHRPVRNQYLSKQKMPKSAPKKIPSGFNQISGRVE